MKKLFLSIFTVLVGLCIVLPAFASVNYKAWINSNNTGPAANVITQPLMVAAGRDGGMGNGGNGGGGMGQGQGGNNDGNGDNQNNDGDGNQNNDGDGDGDGDQNNNDGDRGD